MRHPDAAGITTQWCFRPFVPAVPLPWLFLGRSHGTVLTSTTTGVSTVPEARKVYLPGREKRPLCSGASSTRTTVRDPVVSCVPTPDPEEKTFGSPARMPGSAAVAPPPALPVGVAISVCWPLGRTAPLLPLRGSPNRPRFVVEHLRKFHECSRTVSAEEQVATEFTRASGVLSSPLTAFSVR